MHLQTKGVGKGVEEREAVGKGHQVHFLVLVLLSSVFI